MTLRTQIDKDKLDDYVKRVAGTITAGFNCSISAAGDQLGLYQALKELGPTDSVALAEKTNLSERWVREWLRHQACVGQIDYDAEADQFFLSPEAVAVLLDDSMPTYLAGGFDAVVSTYNSYPLLAESFRSGIGQPYDAHGAGCAHSTERLSAYMQKHELVPTVLPMMEGVVDKLNAGATIADVGCGAGGSTIAMAKAFPNSQFTGYEISWHALERAKENVIASGLTNVEMNHAYESPMAQDHSVDLVTTFDVIHDTPHPDQLIATIAKALASDGTWLCEDIRSFPTFAENLENHPMSGMLYGFSMLVCMSSGLSTPDGMGLGTLGFNEPVAREMTQAAGFSRFQRLDYDNAFNNYYEIRP